MNVSHETVDDRYPSYIRPSEGTPAPRGGLLEGAPGRVLRPLRQQMVDELTELLDAGLHLSPPRGTEATPDRSSRSARASALATVDLPTLSTPAM